MSSTTCIFHDSFLESSRFLAYALHTLTSIEIPLHIFGAYLIIFKTPRAMQTAKYSILLLHSACTVTDLMVTSLWVFYAWIPSSAGISVGLMTTMGVNPLVQVFLAYNTMLAVSLCYVLLFENRYDAIVIGAIGRSPNRNIFRVVYFIFNIILLEAILGYIFWNVPDFEPSRIAVAKTLHCLPQSLVQNDYFVIVNANSILVPYLALSLMCIVCFQGLYFIIYTMYRLFTGSVHVSKSTRRMQRKFFFSMFLQAAIPCMALAAPMYCYYILFELSYFYMAYNNLLMIAIGCNGLFTTLVMIMVHHPYRNAVMEMCKVRRVEKPNSIGGATFLNLRPLVVVSGG